MDTYYKTYCSSELKFTSYSGFEDYRHACINTTILRRRGYALDILLSVAVEEVQSRGRRHIYMCDRFVQILTLCACLWGEQYAKGSIRFDIALICIDMYVPWGLKNIWTMGNSFRGSKSVMTVPRPDVLFTMSSLDNDLYFES